ncbi:MAG: OmpA family protein [Deferrisomatales bacterium]
MRGWWVVAPCLALTACGVSKDLYKAEVVQGQECQARVADLGRQLAEAAARARAAEGEVAARTDEVRTLQADLERAAARSGKQEAQLIACRNREAAARADLDVCRKERTALKGELQAAVRAREAQGRRLQGELESCREALVAAEAREAVLEEEKRRAERKRQEEVDELSRTYAGLVEGLKQEVQEGRVTISQLEGKLTVNLVDEILFDSGSAEIKLDGRKVLKRLGKVVADAKDKAVVVEGHTDNVPISRELARVFPTNWELSTARATSVVRYLQEVAGVSPQRLSAVGFGPYRPVADNDTPEGRAKNRRIQIKLVPLEAPLFAPPTAGGR